MPRHFERVVVIYLENQHIDAVMGNGFMKTLHREARFSVNTLEFTHPSQPNYIAMTAGIPCGVVDDLKHISTRRTSLICLRPKVYLESLYREPTRG